jgi:osomolarity two-component system response regulator SSK1
MKRLKVRWQTAMNGKEAVTKWRAGGFHLVLMDIQLPVMNGLEATREIRRLEKLNSIGVFSSSASSSAPERADEPEGDDKLPSTVLFKSPVIIVALTASSLQSDRHEALAAGCNDFLTKVFIPRIIGAYVPADFLQPVNFVWLERKVMEWGCMQALIDFDGWRKWKDFSQNNTENETSKKAAAASKSKAKKNRMSLGSVGGGTSVNKSIKEEGEDIKR